MSRLGAYRNEIRWTLVVLVFAVLGVVALWPRSPEPGSEGTAPPPQQASQPVSQAQRDAAALADCSPAPQPAAGLEGVTATCLATGEPVDLGKAVAGEPTLVNVWATWCAPCRAELPALQAYSEQPDAIRVVGVQVESGEADGLDLLTELGVHYPNVYDPAGRSRTALPGPNVLPVSYVVTTSGQVRPIEPPTVFTSPEEVRQAVQRTLEPR
ncbi:TlpA family protein disulfide reductase [Saccharopolyspora rectivirgula]|uniref:Redoxin n=1 Tax=Saccharopolyspora rectivirgula TaxID=28042 RepID=A0A073AXB4_9PSEU|nr:TlpA disulfide reductase family protein [Saccharopolyspora rectivirgula]KEI43687.1 redoxin [Saccharopolyspora rectivirgula]